MKKKVLAILSVALMAGLFLLSNPNEAYSGDMGTLYGNASGTKFCCKSGNNGCGAAGCPDTIEKV